MLPCMRYVYGWTRREGGNDAGLEGRSYDED